MQAAAAKTKVLSASKVGFPCIRHLWYAAQGLEEQFDRRSQRIFATGSVLERLVVSFLEEDGFYVAHNDKSHQDETDFVIHLDGGILTGRHDITFIPPNGKPPLILGDIKTMNQRAFTLWRRYGTLKKYPQYVQQLHVYHVGLTQNGEHLADKLAIVGFNKDNSAYAIDYFPFDPGMWESIRARCEYVFNCTEPPPPEANKPAWACSRCGYKHICDCVRIEKPSENIEVLSDEDVELAAYMWEEASNLEAEARELKKEARAILEKLRDKERFRVGDYIVSITPVKSQRLDTKRLKEKAPEIYNTFLKVSVSYRISVKNIQEVA